MTSKLVPLVRPSFPESAKFIPLWEAATLASGQYSNFGPLYNDAVRRLSEMTGRFAIPVSTGTHAVKLAIAAAHASLGGADVSFEAFTFQATALAAKGIDQYARPARSNFVAEDAHADIAVRTIPFGMRRKFADGHAFGEGALVIDAAGAFSPNVIRNLPEHAFVAVSFHATKNFPIGEGGAVFLPRHAGWAAKTIKAAMNFGFDARRNVLPGYATNAKLDELRCAMLLAQLDRESFFVERSKRIGEHVRKICQSHGTKAWFPYDIGEAQSLVVVAHSEPAKLVDGLLEAGFVARRVYHPFVAEHFLSYDEARLVALPSDMNEDELHHLIVTMRGISK